MMDIASQCRFFDYLADLVDPKFYHSDVHDHVNTKYMKRDERAATKRAFKEQYKQNKRAKLNPDAIATTTELQKKTAGEAKEQKQHSEQLQSLGRLHLPAGGQPSRDELLKRLHAKMQAARAARKADESGDNQPQSTADTAKQWREQQLGKKLRAKQQQQRQEQQQQQQSAQKRKQQQQQQQQQDADQPAAKKRRQSAAAAAGDGAHQQAAGLSFSKLVVDKGSVGVAVGKKGKKMTKQTLLKQAEEKQQKLQEAASRQDKDLVAAEAWRAALSRASGEKVLDDPKLLRKSLKREEQDKARKQKRWQERMAAQQEQQQKKQDKRKDNLAARAATKLENKKAKREKKLLRAGFEGRKAGFINAPKSK